MRPDKDTIIRDAKQFLGILGLAYLAMQIAFYKENPLVVIRTTLGLAYLFVLPLLPVIYVALPRLHLNMRLLLSAALGWGSITLASYYLGLHLLDVNRHTWLALAMLVASTALAYFIVGKSNHKGEKDSDAQEKPEENKSEEDQGTHVSSPPA